MNVVTIIALIVGIITIVGFVGNWYREAGQRLQIETNLNNKIDQHIKDNEKVFDSLRGQVSRQWDWQTAHEKESNAMRLEIQRQFGKVEAGLAIHDNQYEEIIRMIEISTKTLTSEIGKLEERIREINKH